MKCCFNDWSYGALIQFSNAINLPTHPSACPSICTFIHHPTFLPPVLSLNRSHRTYYKWLLDSGCTRLPAAVRPINRENLGTSRASRYDVISKAARTNRAVRDTPPCWEGDETPVERSEQRSGS